MPSPLDDTCALILDAGFPDDRNAKLREIWRQRDVELFENFGPGRMSHADAFNEMSFQARQDSRRYVLLAELDFLPAYDDEDLAPVDSLTPKFPIQACSYATRDPGTLKATQYTFPGGWYALYDKNYVAYASFSPGGNFNDPGNLLDIYVKNTYNCRVKLLSGKDCYPAHYGISYRPGTHLFWSKHYQDDPEQTPVVAWKFELKPILDGVDRAIKDYLTGAPNVQPPNAKTGKSR